jgi:hypothetical protein
MKRIIRIKVPSLGAYLYLATPYPFPPSDPWVPFVAWTGKQKNAFRFDTAKDAYACLADLRSYEHGCDAQVARLVKKRPR